MSFVEFLTENYLMIFELIGLAIMLVVSVHIPARVKKMAIIVVALFAVETTFFYLEKWTQSFETLSIARPLLTAAVYSTYPFIMLFLTQVTTPKQYSWKMLLLVSIPIFICVPLFFSSQWTHLVFYFHESNNYAGGPLAYLPYGLFGAYAVLFFVNNFLYFKRYSPINRIIIAYIVLGSLFGVLFFLLTDSGKDYSPLFVSALLLYYIYLYIHMARIDSLTTLMNRQCYYKDLHSRVRTISGVVSIDMNDLKHLNDNLGHAAGDRALVTVAAIMSEHCGKSAFAYRIGGDEFMLIYFGAKEDEIRAAIGRMREEIAKTPYVCAFGYCMKDRDADIEDVVRESDRRMYENKAALKAKAAKKDSK